MTDVSEVILVGHCGPDARLLSAAIRRVAPEAKVSFLNDERHLQSVPFSGRVLMINRILDGDFSSTSGIQLIDRLLKLPDPPRVLLISNHDDAQQQAMQIGALRGFGKSHLYHETTTDAIRSALLPRVKT